MPVSHARGAPFHHQIQGRIERWHQTLKSRVLLENYFLPGDLERQIEAFIEHYNHRRTLHSPGADERPVSRRRYKIRTSARNFSSKVLNPGLGSPAWIRTTNLTGFQRSTSY
jgi:Integrase core domain